LTPSAPYPNPVMARQELHLNLNAGTNCPKKVRLAVYTAAYRKIYAETVQINGPQIWVWDLIDNQGAPIARGVYYLHVEVEGDGTLLDWSPVVVLR
jgi:hypothetical protein